MAESRARSGASSAAAVTAPTWSAPFFNWALHCYRQKRFDAALEKVDEAIVREPSDGAYFALKARILLAMEKREAAVQSAEHAMAQFPPLKEQSDWQLSWFESAASFLKREADLKAVSALRSSRKSTSPSTDGLAQEPDYTG